MTKTLIKPRFFSNKQQKPKAQIENNSSKIPPNLQSFKQKLIPGNGFLVYK